MKRLLSVLSVLFMIACGPVMAADPDPLNSKTDEIGTYFSSDFGGDIAFFGSFSEYNYRTNGGGSTKEKVYRFAGTVGVLISNQETGGYGFYNFYLTDLAGLADVSPSLLDAWMVLDTCTEDGPYCGTFSISFLGYDGDKLVGVVKDEQTYACRYFRFLVNAKYRNAYAVMQYEIRNSGSGDVLYQGIMPMSQASIFDSMQVEHSMDTFLIPGCE